MDALAHVCSGASILRHLSCTVHPAMIYVPSSPTFAGPIDGQGASFSPNDRGGMPSLADLPPGRQPLVFDHGCQAFTTDDDAVAELVAEWLHDGHVGPWYGRFGELDSATGSFVETAAAPALTDTSNPFDMLVARRPLFVGTPSMGDLVGGMIEKAAAAAEASHGGSSLTLLQNVKATRFEHAVEGHAASGARWTVTSTDGNERHFDVLVVAGHAASLAADLALQLPAPADDSEGEARRRAASTLDERLRGVSYPQGTSPLYALMVAFASPLGAAAPFDGARVRGSADLVWISRDSSKPGRARADGVELWVALSTEAFAKRMADELSTDAPAPQGGPRPDEQQLQRIGTRLLEAMSTALGGELPPPVYLHAQRWQAGLTRDALALQPEPCVAWESGGLVACGDWAAGAPGVEHAAKSGLAASHAAARMRVAASAMRALVRIGPPADAESLAERADTQWAEWSCKAYAASPSGRFRESRWWEVRALLV